LGKYIRHHSSRALSLTFRDKHTSHAVGLPGGGRPVRNAKPVKLFKASTHRKLNKDEQKLVRALARRSKWVAAASALRFQDLQTNRAKHGLHPLEESSRNQWVVLAEQWYDHCSHKPSSRNLSFQDVPSSVATQPGLEAPAQPDTPELPASEQPSVDGLTTEPVPTIGTPALLRSPLKRPPIVDSQSLEWSADLLMHEFKAFPDLQAFALLYPNTTKHPETLSPLSLIDPSASKARKVGNRRHATSKFGCKILRPVPRFLKQCQDFTEVVRWYANHEQAAKEDGCITLGDIVQKFPDIPGNPRNPQLGDVSAAPTAFEAGVDSRAASILQRATTSISDIYDSNTSLELEAQAKSGTGTAARGAASFSSCMAWVWANYHELQTGKGKAFVSSRLQDNSLLASDYLLRIPIILKDVEMGREVEQTTFEEMVELIGAYLVRQKVDKKGGTRKALADRICRGFKDLLSVIPERKSEADFSFKKAFKDVWNQMQSQIADNFNAGLIKPTRHARALSHIQFTSLLRHLAKSASVRRKQHYCVLYTGVNCGHRSSQCKDDKLDCFEFVEYEGLSVVQWSETYTTKTRRVDSHGQVSTRDPVFIRDHRDPSCGKYSEILKFLIDPTNRPKAPYTPAKSNTYRADDGNPDITTPICTSQTHGSLYLHPKTASTLVSDNAPHFNPRVLGPDTLARTLQLTISSFREEEPENFLRAFGNDACRDFSGHSLRSTLVALLTDAQTPTFKIDHAGAWAVGSSRAGYGIDRRNHTRVEMNTSVEDRLKIASVFSGHLSSFLMPLHHIPAEVAERRSHQTAAAIDQAIAEAQHRNAGGDPSIPPTPVTYPAFSSHHRPIPVPVPVPVARTGPSPHLGAPFPPGYAPHMCILAEDDASPRPCRLAQKWCSTQHGVGAMCSACRCWCGTQRHAHIRQAQIAQYMSPNQDQPPTQLHPQYTHGVPTSPAGAPVLALQPQLNPAATTPTTPPTQNAPEMWVPGPQVVPVRCARALGWSTAASVRVPALHPCSLARQSSSNTHGAGASCDQEEPWNAVEMEGELTELKSQLAQLQEQHQNTVADLSTTKSNLAVALERTGELEVECEEHQRRDLIKHNQLEKKNEEISEVAFDAELTSLELNDSREKLLHAQQQLSIKAKETEALRILNAKAQISPAKGVLPSRKTNLYRGKQVMFCKGCGDPTQKCACGDLK